MLDKEENFIYNILKIMNNKNIGKIEEIFLGIGRKVCRLIGWKEAIGQVFVLLYIRNQPLSLDDISALTNLSKSNVWGIVQQIGGSKQGVEHRESKRLFCSRKGF